MSAGISPLKRRDFLKALGAAGGMVVLSSGAWGCIGGSTTGNPSIRPTGNMLYTVAGKVQGKFADFIPLPVTIMPSLKDYKVDDISSIGNLDRMGVTDAGKSALARSLFYVTPSSDSQIYDVYKSLDKAELPAFVTTDAMLHTHHILFDYILRMLEMQHFSQDIVDLSKMMLDGSVAQTTSSTGPISAAALKNVAFFAVALTLLGESPDVPADVKGMVQSELSLINGHQGFAKSPIFGYDEDYSQYVPRGHYTRNDTLKKYFMAMMWYGRMMFRLKTDDPEMAKQQTRCAILITLALKDKAFDLWKAIYVPTVFFVGETDDLSLFDYNKLIQDVYGDRVQISALSDDPKLQDFMGRALKMKEPKIVSTDYAGNDIDAIKGFRFMGQRFIPDSYIFQELVYDRVAGPRYFPMGLDAMAVLGSARAYEILDTIYDETRYDGYAQQMGSLKKQFAALKDDAWTQNLYWCWLYCLMALLNEKGDGYPTFMKNEAWTDKELNTSLGSWTELRHDTILYAKQSYGVKAGISGIELPELFPPEPHGYVEPNPELYGRLASLASMASDGLKSRGLLDDVFSDRLSRLKDFLVSLKAIAEKELTGQALSKDDYDLIRYIGNTLESITTVPPDVQGSIASDTDKKMAIVADVHTDPNSNQVLEEGVGNPGHIFVVVPIDGKLTIVEGAAFAYYEFKQPMSDRLTDEQWQDMLKNGKAPEVPVWTKDFTA